MLYSFPLILTRFSLQTGEWYEYPTLSLYQCSGFENPDCNAQWGTKLGLDKAGDIGKPVCWVFYIFAKSLHGGMGYLADATAFNENSLHIYLVYFASNSSATNFTAGSVADDDDQGTNNNTTDSTDQQLHPLAPLWLNLIRRGAKDHMFYLGRELGCKQQGMCVLCVEVYHFCSRFSFCDRDY